MRWATDVACPQKCGGNLDVYDEENDHGRFEYLYICPDCGTRGSWRQFASSLHPAPYRPKGTSP